MDEIVYDFFLEVTKDGRIYANVYDMEDDETPIHTTVAYADAFDAQTAAREWIATR